LDNLVRRRLALVGIAMFGVMLTFVLAAPAAFAQPQTSSTSGGITDYTFDYVSAAAAIIGSSAAAAWAVARTATAAAAAIAERPTSFGPMLILAGLGEGIAIYGLLVAFEILSKVP
jgi:V/A-type H+/Na+-transporting ATPase subunit K